ncbi:MAG: glycosyltransferase family 9 protein [bacterium]
MLKKIENILVIRLSSMGDVILTTALIRQIRNKYPNTRLDFATSKQFAEIFTNNPHISNLIEYDKQSSLKDINDLKKNIKSKIPSGRYDLVIDLQRNIRSRVFRSGLGAQYLYVKKMRLHKLSMVYFKRPLLKKIVPIPEIYRMTASPLDIEDDGKGLELWLPNETLSPIYLPEEKKVKNSLTIAIAPGAFHNTKRWQKEKYLELIIHLKENFYADIVLIGGKKDKEITDWITSKITFEFEDCTESDSIIRTVSAIDSASLLISNDTGVVHIAAARKVPVVAIFGSTVKEFGFIPFRTKHEIVEKILPCRPCTHYGLNKCPKVHFDCMNKISVEDVVLAVQKLILKKS